MNKTQSDKKHTIMLNKEEVVKYGSLLVAITMSFAAAKYGITRNEEKQKMLEARVDKNEYQLEKLDDSVHYIETEQSGMKRDVQYIRQSIDELKPLLMESLRKN